MARIREERLKNLERVARKTGLPLRSGGFGRGTQTTMMIRQEEILKSKHPVFLLLSPFNMLMVLHIHRQSQCKTKGQEYPVCAIRIGLQVWVSVEDKGKWA
jgi:hypothetical protein